MFSVRAVDVAEKAVAAIPPHHPNRARLLNNLENQLGTRFRRTGAMDDLNRAVDVTDQARPWRPYLPITPIEQAY
jgi:hypothetical protein